MSRTFAFFATDPEVVDIWLWIAEMPGMRFFEGSSRPDKQLQTFAEFPAEVIRDPKKFDSIVAWPSLVSIRPIEREVLFSDETKQRLGARGRTILTGPSLIRFVCVSAPKPHQISFHELVYETLSTAKVSHLFSDHQVESTDWDLFRKVIQRIKKHIEKSQAKSWRSIPVLPGVACQLEDGNARLWYWGHEGTI